MNFAINYFKNLQTQPISTNLAEYLSAFRLPKAIHYENFIKGMKIFIQLANMHPEKGASNRQTLYGSIYSGLHYHIDLAQLWNQQHPKQEPIKALALTTLVPPKWTSSFKEGYVFFFYQGHQPAQALDELIKGPTVIDCGMFVQLCLWFGIRYMLGDEKFNQSFGRAPLFITQLVFEPIIKNDAPFSGNPLYCFLSNVNSSTIVMIKHMTNIPSYPLKHPGGIDGGENCIVIDNQYYIFHPDLDHPEGITEETLNNLLLDAFNQEITENDVECFVFFASKSEFFNLTLMQTFGQLIEAAKQLSQIKYTKDAFIDEIQQQRKIQLSFDLDKFSIWLKKIENPKYVETRVNFYDQFNIFVNEHSKSTRYHIDACLFRDYDSPQYLCRPYQADLSNKNIHTTKVQPSIGAIVYAICWELRAHQLGDIDIIPTFDMTGPTKNAYHTPISVTPIKFEQTSYKTIALEIKENHPMLANLNKKYLHPYSMAQLIRVVDEAHEQGNKRVIFINHTQFSTEQLLRISA